jgi:DNA polymerase I-like protein with 3'-5' exonuclease and polymerase domains
MAECLDEDAVEVGHTIADVMQQTARDVYTDFVPFTTEVKIGKDWGSV